PVQLNWSFLFCFFYICTDSFFSLFIFSRFRLLKLSNIFNTNTIASMINMLSGTPVIRLCLSPALIEEGLCRWG
ncbi:hypothetical protein, partial [Bacillus halotolerans]|uniref:hypothetical protein n=1 Tax=Bacillus halotolerans TaxID=260554 RepID=UPI001C3D03DA